MFGSSYATISSEIVGPAIFRLSISERGLGQSIEIF